MNLESRLGRQLAKSRLFARIVASPEAFESSLNDLQVALGSAGVHEGAIHKVMQQLQAIEVKKQVVMGADPTARLIAFANALHEALASVEATDEVVAEWFEEFRKATVNTYPTAAARAAISGEDSRRRN